MRLLLLPAILMSATLIWANSAWSGEGDGKKVAFFGIMLIDTSLEAATGQGHAAEQARIEMIADIVTKRFVAEGYTLMDIEPVRKDIERVVNPAKCYGCDTRAAEELGADYSLVGEVQKVSNLILAMNLQMRDAKSGEMVKGRVVDIRGNTDESWSRGITYILDRTFFK